MRKFCFFYESKIPFPSDTVEKWLLHPHSFERTVPPGKSIPKFDHHKSRVLAISSRESYVQEELFCSLPFYVSKKWIEKKVNRFFAYRHSLIEMDLLRLERSPLKEPLKILMTGSSGFVGKALCEFLEAAGHLVFPLSRSQITEGHLDEFEGCDAVIHLAGESLVKGFWTQKKKKKILESRQKGTENLVHLLKQLKSPPKVFLSASAIGYYGSSQSPVTEMSLPGEGFLSQVCVAWEAASKPLEEVGIRTVHARFGLILSGRGGILKALLPLFRLGLGGRMGDGKQIMSWIALEDVIGALYHILGQKDLRGPINMVSPYPVSQEVFAKTLARVVSRPCLFSFPRFLFPGEKAKELLFSSVDVIPACLEQSGFIFSYPRLEEALKHSITEF